MTLRDMKHLHPVTFFKPGQVPTTQAIKDFRPAPVAEAADAPQSEPEAAPESVEPEVEQPEPPAEPEPPASPPAAAKD